MPWLGGDFAWRKNETYEFIVWFLKNHAPGRDITDVRIVSGDGFVNQDMLKSVGFANSAYITGRKHLRDREKMELRFGKE